MITSYERVIVFVPKYLANCWTDMALLKGKLLFIYFPRISNINVGCYNSPNFKVLLDALKAWTKRRTYGNTIVIKKLHF